MIRSSILSQALGAVVAVAVVSTGLPAFAADGSPAAWFAQQKQVLRQKLEQAPPVTFKFIGDRIVPVFVKQSPRYTVIVEAVDAPFVGGSSTRAMR
jgi:hypothetical protein